MALKPSFTLPLLVLSALASADSITKAPDLGLYWSALGQDTTLIYANSFVAPSSGDVKLQSLGFWLYGGSSELQFQIFADNNNTPDATSILSSSAITSGQYGGLTLVTMPMSDLTLTAGQRYWAAASTVGLGGTGNYLLGGHTQNSGGIVDNGTFWYSNNGTTFDGKYNTPEIAFQVNVEPVPEPATMAALAMGGLSVLVRRRKRA